MSPISESPRFRYRQWFPWLELFRAGGLAVSWPQIGISFVAIIVFWLGTWAIGLWYPQETPAIFAMELIQFEPSENANGQISIRVFPTPVIEPQLVAPLDELLKSWSSIVSPIRKLILFDPRPSRWQLQPGSRIGLLLNLAWAVAVWSLFGMAICRAAAVQIARDRTEAFPLAIRYAKARWFSAIGAPSIPAAGILGVFLPLIIAAWFGRLPWIGTPVLMVLSSLLFLAGLAMACLALVIVCGWPLMIAAMAIEDCDGFGALSRTISFLMGRPVHAAWNALVSAIYGSALVALVMAVFTLALLAEAGPLDHIGVPESWAAILRGSHWSARVLLATFSVSLFWSLVTLNYLLLREAVDRKPFEEISAGVDEPARTELPVVGMPASDYRPEEHDGQPAEAEAVAPVV